MNILCIHQGAELYGSDRSFCVCVKFLRDLYPTAKITVVLPSSGPLLDMVSKYADETKVEEIVKLQKKDAKYFLINKFIKALLVIKKKIAMINSFDLVYINTLVIFDYILALRFSDSKSIVHVREIPYGIAQILFSIIIRISKPALIFNSSATKKALFLTGNNNQYIVLNGIKGYTDVSRNVFASSKSRLLVIGRINAWKGQELLVEAVSKIPEHIQKNIWVKIVGGVFKNEEKYLDNLIKKIEVSKIKAKIEVLPFSDNPKDYYEWADIVVVPSIKPEPFGLVAIEAMSAGRIVLAANHGGLPEIIEDGKVGFLFCPGDSSELATKLASIIDRRLELNDISSCARERFYCEFSEEAFKSRFQYAIVKIVKS